MSVEEVREYFKQWDMDNRIIEFDVSSATVELAARALECASKRIAKTLSFNVNDQCVLIVTSGDAKIDNQKFKAEFNTKAKMMSRDETYKRVGHAVGGVCPFAIHKGVSVYLDVSLKRFETVFPACGSSNSVIELTLDELEKYSKYKKWIDVCKEWKE